jgi:hypothetical protein
MQVFLQVLSFYHHLLNAPCRSGKKFDEVTSRRETLPGTRVAHIDAGIFRDVAGNVPTVLQVLSFYHHLLHAPCRSGKKFDEVTSRRKTLPGTRLAHIDAGIRRDVAGFEEKVDQSIGDLLENQPVFSKKP